MGGSITHHPKSEQLRVRAPLGVSVHNSVQYPNACSRTLSVVRRLGLERPLDWVDRRSFKRL